MCDNTEEEFTTNTNPSGPNESPHTTEETQNSTEAVDHTEIPAQPNAAVEEDTLFAEAREEIFNGMKRCGMFVSTRFLAHIVQREIHSKVCYEDLDIKYKDALHQMHDTQEKLQQMEVTLKDQNTDFEARKQVYVSIIKCLQHQIRNQKSDIDDMEKMCSYYGMYMLEQKRVIESLQAITYNLHGQLDITEEAVRIQADEIARLELLLAQYKKSKE